VYNEQVTDLLTNARQFNTAATNTHGLRVKTADNGGSYYIEDLSCIQVSTYQDVMHLVESGRHCQKVLARNNARRASTAHVFMTWAVTHIYEERCAWTHVQGDIQLVKKMSHLSILDMAGSERPSTANGTNGIKSPAKHVPDRGNTSTYQSMSTFRQCVRRQSRSADVTQMIQPTAPDFRASVLTKLLKSSIGGSTKTVLLAVVSPSECDAEESRRTLDFAEQARNVFARATINRKVWRPVSNRLGLDTQIHSLHLEKNLEVVEREAARAMDSREMRLGSAEREKRGARNRDRGKREAYKLSSVATSTHAAELSLSDFQDGHTEHLDAQDLHLHDPAASKGFEARIRRFHEY